MNAPAEPVWARADFETSGTPLLSSRSLGRLLGLESFQFKVECWQPTGSWLDRSAVKLVAAALEEGRTGLCALGPDVWTLPLAVQCARAGLRFVVLEPTVPAAPGVVPGPGEADRSRVRRWLSALGARIVAVEARASALREAAPSAVERAGLRLVCPDDPLLQAGLSALVHEVGLVGRDEQLLAVPGLTGREEGWLAATARRSASVPLPLSDLPSPPAGRPFAVVGVLQAQVPGASDRDQDPAEAADASRVLSVAVSPREADAARRLLAREEGLLVSQRGGAGLAGLVRAVREDRARRPRERRLQQVTSAIVVLTGDPLWAGGEPPPEPDSVRRRPIPLEALQADLARLLVEPPGR